MFNELKNNKLNPDIYTFSTIIDYFLKNNNKEKATEYLNEMKTFRITPNIIILSLVINKHLNCFCKLRQ